MGLGLIKEVQRGVYVALYLTPKYHIRKPLEHFLYIGAPIQIHCSKTNLVGHEMQEIIRCVFLHIFV